MSVSVEAARLRFAEAKSQESLALDIVKSQRALFEMIKRNMAKAQAKLDSSRREVKAAEMMLEKAIIYGNSSDDCIKERRISDEGKTRYKNLDLSSAGATSSNGAEAEGETDFGDNRVMASTTSGMGMKRASSGIADATSTDQQTKTLTAQSPMLPSPRYITDGDNPRPLGQNYTPKLNTRRRNHPSQEPKLQLELLNLSPEAKMILREVVLSAILHPEGKVEPGMLERARECGLSDKAVQNAVSVARIRVKKKGDSMRDRLERRLTPSQIRSGGAPQEGHSKIGETSLQTNCQETYLPNRRPHQKRPNLFSLSLDNS